MRADDQQAGLGIPTIYEEWNFVKAKHNSVLLVIYCRSRFIKFNQSH